MYSNLSDEALDALLNAHPRVGGHVGVMHPDTRNETTAELRSAGLTGPQGGLTRRGVQVARMMQDAHWSK